MDRIREELIINVSMCERACDLFGTGGRVDECFVDWWWRGMYEAIIKIIAASRKRQYCSIGCSASFEFSVLGIARVVWVRYISARFSGFVPALM